MNPRASDANFDRIAHLYRWLEFLSFGRALERCRNHFLPQLSHCRHALVFGDGDGRFLARLLAAHPALHAEAIDTSSAMLHTLRRRAEASVSDVQSRLLTHQTDALTFIPTQPYDLIVTHFFLDCLSQSQVDALAQGLVRQATNNTLWLISDFRIPAGRMQWPARTIVRLLYLAFRLLTGLRTCQLPDHSAALEAAGFCRQTRRLSLGGLLTTELWTHTTTGPTLPYNIHSL